MREEHQINTYTKQTATLKNAGFCDVTLCGSYKNRRLGRMHRIHHKGEACLRSVLQLLVTANVVPGSLTLSTLIK
jgi:hypothetical protein